mgnify:CR=1 FL=1
MYVALCVVVLEISPNQGVIARVIYVLLDKEAVTMFCFQPHPVCTFNDCSICFFAETRNNWSE